MPSGEMRRPPQIWEQRLARTTAVLGVGLSNGGDATAVVPPTPPPGSGGGVEPAPVLPPPGAFIKPSTPQLIGGLQGINVLWDGLNSASELWPYDTSWVEVHMDTTGTAFTPGTATLKGRLARPGSLFVGGLTAGSAYYFKLRGADPAGNYTEASDAATGFTGLTTASDYGTATIGTGAVSFNARTIGGVTNTVGSAAPSNPILGDVWLDNSAGTAVVHKVYNGSTWVTNAWGSASIAAGQITALQIAAGAITAGAIAADAITGKTITGGTVTGAQITGGTITGGFISGGTVSGGLVSGGTVSGAVISGATITSTSVSGYATSSDIANFITAGQVNGNVTSISGGSITSGTITGIVIRSASSGRRVELNSSGYTHAVVWRDSSGNIAYDMGADPTNILSLFGSGATKIFATNCSIDTSADLKVSGATDLVGALDVETSTAGAASNNRAFRVDTSGQVFSYGIDDNTTASAANVRVEQTGSRQLVRSTSTARLKDELAPLSDDLAGVDPAKIATFPASIDPYDVLSVTPTEFRSLCAVDADARMFGFIAEDVAAKLPWAANWDDQGMPSAVEDRPILAALLQVVKDQQATISALIARIEALEA